MDIRNEMPEEVKNQTVNGKPRVITEKIPEKFIKKIAEKLALKNKRLHAFVQVSFQIAKGQETQQVILRDLKSVGDSLSDAIKDAYKKLKLAKKVEYKFRFDGKENFIGVMNPPKTKKEEGKK